MILNSKPLALIRNKAIGEFDPFYLYDCQIIRDNCRMFRKLTYANKSIHFATMANINPQFLQIVKEEKIDVFVNSLLHLQAVQEVGFKNEEIVFTSSALTEKAMQKAESCGVQLNLDSPKQLEKWQHLFPEKKVGIRCNIGDKVKPWSTCAGYFIGEKSRLGFTHEEIDQIPDKLIINGLHLYVGTDIFDIDYFIRCYRELVELAKKFPNIEYLNFGGGFGVSENGEQRFNISAFDAQVTQLMNEASNMLGKNIKMIIEPGRIIGGEAGYFVCCVTDIKKRKKQTLVGVNASTVQFSRPLLYPDTANHPFAIIRNGELLINNDTEPATIFGCSTYSRDIFAANKPIPADLKIGDTIVFGNAGSYSASSYLQFLGFHKTEEFFL